MRLIGEPSTYLVMLYENGAIINAFNVHAQTYKSAQEIADGTIQKVYPNNNTITKTINRVN
jgi:hypothetical protein